MHTARSAAWRFQFCPFKIPSFLLEDEAIFFFCVKTAEQSRDIENMIYGTTIAALSFAGLASAKIYFKENFNDASWKSRWTVPTGWKSEVIHKIS